MTGIARAIRFCLAALSVAVADPAFAADYYAGRRLVVLINYAAGGPADIEGRIFAKHFGRHIAGSPTVIVQNMDGAAGMVGANYMGEIAPKDGTMLGMLTASSWQFALDDGKARVDYKTYEYVGTQQSTTVYFMRSDVKPGIKAPADLANAQGLVVGGLGADSTKDLLLRLTLDLLGHKYKYVTGYRGSNAARLALQQGEINFYSESPPSYRSLVEPGLVAKGEAIGVFYDPSWDGRSLTRSSQVDGLPMPSFPELYKQIKGTEPSGKLWQHYLTILALNGELFRIAVLAPGTPKAAVDALRAGMTRLATDKEFAEDANKAFGYVPSYFAGPDTNERVRAALNTTPEMKAFVAEYVAAGSNYK